MKKQQILSLGLILAANLSLCLIRPSAKAAADRTPTHDVVVIQSASVGLSLNDTNGYTYQYDGLVIFNSSSSTGAPVFPQGTVPTRYALTNTADGIALLLDQGFRGPTELKDGSLIFIRTR